MNHYEMEIISRNELLVYSCGVEQLGSFLGDIQSDLDKLNFKGRVTLFQIGPDGFGNDVTILSYDGEFTRIKPPFSTDLDVDEYIEKELKAA